MLILLSAVLVVGQILLTGADPFVLWLNWGVAGIFSLGLWLLMGKFHLGGVSDGKSMAIVWPLMSVTLNFAYLYFNPSNPVLFGLLHLSALMGIITLMLSIWQEEQATLRNLCIGLLIGICSTFFPHTILWLLLIPLAMFHLRSTSLRNGCSILTGALMGIWIVYCLYFIGQGAEAADGIIRKFSELFDMASYVEVLSSFSLWHWLFIAMLVLMVIIYSLSAMVLGTGHSVRASACIMLISTLSIASVFFLCIDINNTALYICQLALFLCIQLTIHQANLRSSANEWWTIFIILLSFGISVLPLI